MSRFNWVLTQQEKNLEKILKQKDEAIRQLEEKNKEMVLFSNIMSHDLKAPLRSISGFCGLLQQELTKSDKEKQEYLSFIQNSASSMGILIDDLLTYSMIANDRIPTEKLDVNLLIKEVASSFHYQLEDNSVDLKVENLPTIHGNRRFLKILFQNLISNSIKFQPKEKQHVPTIRINSFSDSEFEYINIIDNGIGIEPNYKEFLFLPFKRFHKEADYEGTGLGMSICKKIMEKHNGVIKLSESSNEGSTFQLKFKREQNKCEVQDIWTSHFSN